MATNIFAKDSFRHTISCQQLEMSVEQTDGKVTCNFSKEGVSLIKNIPLVVDFQGNLPLSAHAITYYPKYKIFACRWSDLKTEAQPEKGRISSYKKLTATQIAELKEKDHPDAKWTLMTNLGSYLRKMEKYPAALKLGQAALELAIKTHGETHPDVAVSYNDIGITFEETEDHVGALKFFQKALEIRKLLFGKRDVAVAGSYNNIGVALGELGNHEEALKFKKKALALRKELLGKKHLTIALMYKNVGVTLVDLGHYFEALEAFRKALKLQKELLGEKHSDIVASYYNIAITLGKLGLYRKALENCLTAFSHACEVYPEKHPNHELCLDGILFFLTKQPNRQTAENIKTKALSLCIEKFGEDDVFTKKLRNS